MNKKLLLLKSILNKNSAQIKFYLNQKDISTGKFHQFLRSERLESASFMLIVEAGVKHLFSEDFIQQLKSVHLKQCIRNEQIFTEMGSLQDQISSQDKPVIFLKGLLSSFLFWGDIDRRAVVDVDILLPRV